MSQSESDEVAKGDFSGLLLLVDVANIRPRSIKNKKQFHANFGMKLPLFNKTKYEFTSFAFIDQCLFDLARSAPGAVIVKYADFGLKSQLVGHDGDELLRRNSLDDYDSDKIFIVGASKADNALLTASFEVGGSIISQDRFEDPEYAELWTENTRLFRHSYNEESGQFEFHTHDGLSLQTWWQDENNFVSGEWLASDEYLEVELRLRNQAKQANWQWITTPLVHNPVIPAEVFERIDATSREKRRQARRRYTHRPKKSSGRTREVVGDNDALDLDIYDPLLGADVNEVSGETPTRKRHINAKRSAHKPKKSSGRNRDVFFDQHAFDLEVDEPLVEFKFSEPKRSRAVCYLLADDFHGMRKNIGNYVTVVGRTLINEGKVSLQWIPGVESVEIINCPTIDESVGTSFVQLDGVLEVRDQSMVLRVDADEMFTVVSYAHIREERNAQSRKSRVWPEKEARTWGVPSFVESIQNLWSLQQFFFSDERVKRVVVEESETSSRFIEKESNDIQGGAEEVSFESTDAASPRTSDVADDSPKPNELTKGIEADGERDVSYGNLRYADEIQIDRGQSEDSSSNTVAVKNFEDVEPARRMPINASDSAVPHDIRAGNRSEGFYRRPAIVIGILVALLVSIVAYLTFSSATSDEIYQKPVDGAQSSVAQWRYFESVVWRK